MSRNSMKERARSALRMMRADDEFTAPELAHQVRILEHPEHEPLRVADLAASPRTFHWLDAVKGWEKANSASDGNMRRICQVFVAEGLLTCRTEQRGWYVRRFYRLAAPETE